MKVLLINGSPHEKGCTYTALAEVAKTLEEEGIEAEIAWIGKGQVRGCIACGGCRKADDGRCVFKDDCVDELIGKAVEADGMIVGSPVYFAGINGALKCVLDRLFYSSSALLKGKPAAGVASARRAGTTLTIDQINKFFQIVQMPVVSSTYWPMIHGNTAEEAQQDAEGLQTMRVLARNMAWMLRGLDRQEMPITEEKVRTNFIR